MAKDDIFVIVYQILKYLYGCLKNGEKPEAYYLQASAYSVNEKYWMFIIMNLITEGYIKGISTIETKDGIMLGDLQDAVITMKGAEYLFDNSLLAEAKRTLKDVKGMISFA